MTLRFDPAGGTIVVRALISGVSHNTVARLSLDTGANMTMLNRELAASLGYDVEHPERMVRIATAGGVVRAPQITIGRIAALGKERLNFPIICRSLPSSVSVDGLLGIDFFHGQRLTIDFREGLITLD